ncbi:polysaccharide biosynthesis/export family protein [Paraburkholderia hayleyella]|uniref:polysaccharide biosynthesis/export family protein n=1 Tax=Paraburkholderia hayleyella TaxID=2152889 RepID=UPI001FEAD41A|nr:polysaccharide biosynthesis/export family protein [Paraburkholderia hayleyella]
MDTTDTPAAAGGGASPPAAQAAVPFINIDASVIDRLHEEAQAQVLATRQAEPLERADAAYIIGPGDVLQITVWDHPELVAASNGTRPSSQGAADPVAGFAVDHNGNVQFPYAGSVRVAGLRPDQADARLASALSKFFRKPQVTVRIASFRARYIHVIGAVRSPGGYPFNDVAMTLPEAISRAGGLAVEADSSRIVIVRGGRSYPANLARMLDNGEDPAHLILAPGDILRVPSRSDSAVYVIGEVRHPVLALPDQYGRLTLGDALLQAHSLDLDTVDASQLFVIRGSAATPHVFRLDSRSPVAMVLAGQFELQPKDVVYVGSGDLVRFSRVLRLMLPAFNAGALGSHVAD